MSSRSSSNTALQFFQLSLIEKST